MAAIVYKSTHGIYFAWKEFVYNCLGLKQRNETANTKGLKVNACKKAVIKFGFHSLEAPFEDLLS